VVTEMLTIDKLARGVGLSLRMGRCVDAKGRAVYTNESGNHCVIGWALDDVDAVVQGADAVTVFELEALRRVAYSDDSTRALAEALQQVHDMEGEIDFVDIDYARLSRSHEALLKYYIREMTA